MTERLNKEAALSRRAALIQTMSQLEEKGVHCGACSGVCCTFVANSVQATPLETLEILNWLRDRGALDDALKQTLQATIQKYRLDQDAPGDGSRQFVRRTYTCPFFGMAPGGCGLSRSVKPYGCLGFNAMAPGVQDGENCGSNIALLEEREDAFAETEARANRRIQEQYSLKWEKKPMPAALMDLIEKTEPGVRH